MNWNPDHFQALMKRLQRSERRAVRELTDSFGPEVSRLVRGRLRPVLRSRFDAVDFLPDVWAEFFAVPPTERTFTQPQSLLNHLALLARKKIEAALWRDLGPGKPNQHFTEALLQLLADLPAHHRAIADLLMQGKKPIEIAKLQGISERTVFRIARSMLREVGVDDA